MKRFGYILYIIFVRPPSGCLQWETGVTGRFSTFNYQDVDGVHLRNQDYSYCIRQEYGKLHRDW